MFQSGELAEPRSPGTSQYGCTPAALPVAAPYCSPIWSKMLVQFVTRNYSVDRGENTEGAAGRLTVQEHTEEATVDRSPSSLVDEICSGLRLAYAAGPAERDSAAIRWSIAPKRRPVSPKRRSPPEPASSTGHVSPAGRRSSRTAAASSSATSY